MDLIDTDEQLAESMLEFRGDLSEVSRLPNIGLSLMQLRAYVARNPRVRQRYHEMLAEELQESQLHIAERILKMAELQKKAFGNLDEDIPADPKLAIELSKEISRLIAEGRGVNISQSKAQTISSKEDVRDMLEKFLMGD